MRGHFAAAKGFTLVEMMAVVALIATISALAAPSVIRQARARRLQRDALEVLSILQEARSRSLGRGAATRVVWNGTELSVSERMVDVDGLGNLDLPAVTCAEPGGVWTPSRRWFRPGAQSDNTLELVTCDNTDCSATIGVEPYLEVCFTSRGQTRARANADPATAWTPFTRVIAFTVTSREGGGTSETNVTGRRMVLLAPNGLARLRL
jgi:prepilin-type N-terminal cleavage/methylation domain-containing protein